MKPIVAALPQDPEVTALQQVYYSRTLKHLNAKVAADMVDALDRLRSKTE